MEEINCAIEESDVQMLAADAKECLLPTKSKNLYENMYAAYNKWCKTKKITKTTEDSVLAYFNSELKSYKSSSLWTKYSMLRSTINLKEGIDISTFPSVIPYLKRKAEGHKPKKSFTLNKQDVDRFLTVADERQHLLNKVILIFGIAGACRRHELVSLTTTAVQDSGTHFLVKLTDTKTKKDRSFVILPGELENLNLLDIIRKYIQLRPAHINHNRFFINFVKEKCTVQPVGVHKIAGVPSVVAKFLGLENPSLYTGHCFRRTSASILANSGATMESIKRHGGWRSSTVAEGYIDESENSKINVATRILGQECPASSTGSSRIVEVKNFQDSAVENCASASSSTTTDVKIYNDSVENCASNSTSSGLAIYKNKDCVINIHYHPK